MKELKSFDFRLNINEVINESAKELGLSPIKCKKAWDNSWEFIEKAMTSDEAPKIIFPHLGTFEVSLSRLNTRLHRMGRADKFDDKLSEKMERLEEIKERVANEKKRRKAGRKNKERG